MSVKRGLGISMTFLGARGFVTLLDTSYELFGCFNIEAYEYGTPLFFWIVPYKLFGHKNMNILFDGLRVSRIFDSCPVLSDLCLDRTCTADDHMGAKLCAEHKKMGHVIVSRS